MRFERYYYTEYKEESEARIKKMRENLRLQKETIQKLSEKEQTKLHEKQKEVVDELLSEIMLLPSEVCTIINPVKYDQFLALAEESISLAEKLHANLLLQAQDMTGCITFVGEELSHIGERKDMLEKLITAADEVHIALSMDTGGGKSNRYRWFGKNGILV